MSDRRYNRVLPLRVELEVVERSPRASTAAETPLVYLRFRLDLHLGGTPNHRRDLYVEAEVQVDEDKGVEILWLEPQNEIIKGAQTEEVLGLYKDSLLLAIEESNLRILGVS